MSEEERKAVEAGRLETAGYVLDPAFRAEWLGITGRSRDYLAQHVRVFGQLMEEVTTSLDGWKILDVGCGDGRWLRRMVEYDARPEDVVGVDISDARFPIAAAKNPQVELLRIDEGPYPFEDGRFDLAIQSVCFSSIPGKALREHAAAEMRRVLRPGGYVFWWDLPRTTSPTDRGTALDPADYFDWPMRRLEVGPRQLPSETLRPFRGRGVIAPLLDRLSHPPTHTAALIGPKPREHA